MQLEEVAIVGWGLPWTRDQLFPDIIRDGILFLHDYEPGLGVVSSLRHLLVRGGGGPSWSLPCKIVPASLCPSGHPRTLKFWPNEMTGWSHCGRTRISSRHDSFDIYLVGTKAYLTHGTVLDFHGTRNLFQPSFASVQSFDDFQYLRKCTYIIYYVIIQRKLIFPLSSTIIYHECPFGEITANHL